MVFARIVETLPKKQAMVVSLGLIIGVSTAAFVTQFYLTGKDNGGAHLGEPRTTSKEWKAASLEYNKAQKANPIRHFGEKNNK